MRAHPKFLVLSCSITLALAACNRGGEPAATAAGADAEAQAAVVDGLRVAVVADTVLAYVDLCGSTRALATAREVVGVRGDNVGRGGVGRVGDRVQRMETRPLSATKHWRLVEVLEKAK